MLRLGQVKMGWKSSHSECLENSNRRVWEGVDDLGIFTKKRREFEGSDRINKERDTFRHPMCKKNHIYTELKRVPVLLHKKKGCRQNYYEPLYNHKNRAHRV